MEEIRTNWQIPSIAHFCNLFRNSLDLPDFDYEDLEFAFLSNLSSDGLGSSETNLILRLICSLLKGYFNVHINQLNYYNYLKKIIQIQWVCNEKRRSPFVWYNEKGEEIEVLFDDLSLTTKIEIVHCLCDYRLFKDDVYELTKEDNADEYRIEPLGRDSKGCVYWYFYGTRLYRENPTIAATVVANLKKIDNIDFKLAEESRKKSDHEKLQNLLVIQKQIELQARKRAEEAKKLESSVQSVPKKGGLPPKVKGSRTGLRDRKQINIPNGVTKLNNSLSSPINESSEKVKVINIVKNTNKLIKPIVTLKDRQEAWSLVCESEQDWLDLTNKFKSSRVKCEQEFYRILSESFVPKINEIFLKAVKDKQKVERQKLYELLPRRLSSRIELKKIRAEQREIEEEEEKKRKLEMEKCEMQAQRSERIRLEREKRAQQRLQMFEERAERTRRKIHNEINCSNNEDEYNSIGDNESPTPPPIESIIEDTIDANHTVITIEDFYEGLEKVINCVKFNRDSWPFRQPVDKKLAPMYDEVIEKPIDLSVIEQKVKNRSYHNLLDVELDFKTLINNCETYNGPKNGYTIMAYAVWRAFKKAVKRYLENIPISLDEEKIFIYPQKPTNTNILPAIEAKKKKSLRKKRTSRALNVLAEAAERAVKDTTSRSSSIAASSPRSSMSYDESTSDGVVQETIHNYSVHGDMIASYLINSNNNHSIVSNHNQAVNENLTFKSLDEWSKSIKQSGNAIVLPQHAVVVSSASFANNCLNGSNGSLVKSNDDQKFIKLKVVSNSNKTENSDYILNGNSSSISSDNENAQNTDSKRLVIKLSRCESGHAWKPVQVITNSLESANVSPKYGVESANVQQMPEFRKSPNNCMPMKKRFNMTNGESSEEDDEDDGNIKSFPSDSPQMIASTFVNNSNSFKDNRSFAHETDLASSTPSFQITGYQQNKNSNLKVLRLKKLDNPSQTISHNSTQNESANHTNSQCLPKVLLVPLSNQSLNGNRFGGQPNHNSNSHIP